MKRPSRERELSGDQLYALFSMALIILMTTIALLIVVQHVESAAFVSPLASAGFMALVARSRPDAISVAPVLPVAPVAPVAPVLPIAPIAPIAPIVPPDVPTPPASVDLLTPSADGKPIAMIVPVPASKDEGKP